MNQFLFWLSSNANVPQINLRLPRPLPQQSCQRRQPHLFRAPNTYQNHHDATRVERGTSLARHAKRHQWYSGAQTAATHLWRPLVQLVLHPSRSVCTIHAAIRAWPTSALHAYRNERAANLCILQRQHTQHYTAHLATVCSPRAQPHQRHRPLRVRRIPSWLLYQTTLGKHRARQTDQQLHTKADNRHRNRALTTTHQATTHQTSSAPCRYHGRTTQTQRPSGRAYASCPRLQRTPPHSGSRADFTNRQGQHYTRYCSLRPPSLPRVPGQLGQNAHIYSSTTYPNSSSGYHRAKRTMQPTRAMSAPLSPPPSKQDSHVSVAQTTTPW